MTLFNITGNLPLYFAALSKFMVVAHT